MNLAMQKVMKIRGYNVTTGEMELVLKGLKESTFTNGKESTFVTVDNVKIASFDFGSNAMISGSSAYIQDDLLAAQLGTDVETLTDTKEISFNEILTVSASNSATGSKVATGTADAEIKFAYILDADGSKVSTLTQGATASAGVFTYDSATKVFTFHTDVLEGTKVEVKYYPNTTTAKRISNITTNFTKTLRLEAEILFKNVCDDQLVYGMIVAEKGKIAGEFEWNMTEGGDPSVHNFTADFLGTCIENKLFDVYIYDKEDME